jgi:hypothetical protein
MKIATPNRRCNRVLSSSQKDGPSVVAQDELWITLRFVFVPVVHMMTIIPVDGSVRHDDPIYHIISDQGDAQRCKSQICSSSSKHLVPSVHFPWADDISENGGCPRFDEIRFWSICVGSQRTHEHQKPKGYLLWFRLLPIHEINSLS